MLRNCQPLLPCGRGVIERGKKCVKIFQRQRPHPALPALRRKPAFKPLKRLRQHGKSSLYALLVRLQHLARQPEAKGRAKIMVLRMRIVAAKTFRALAHQPRSRRIHDIRKLCPQNGLADLIKFTGKLQPLHVCS